MKNKSFLCKTDFYYNIKMKKFPFTTSVAMRGVLVRVEMKELENWFERVRKKTNKGRSVC